MARFGQFKFGEDSFGSDGIPPRPSERTERIAWNFFDGVNSYDLPINPNEAKMPSRRRPVATKATCAGRQVMYQGRLEVPTIEFSGVLLDETQYRIFKEWFNRRKQIRITDDLGIKYWVYLKSFQPTRVKSNDYDWYHNYSASGVVLDRG